MNEIETQHPAVARFLEAVPDVVDVKVEPLYDGHRVTVIFQNGYGASVISHSRSYGGSDGLWELAVVGRNGELTYETPITSDVIGYMQDSDVIDTLRAVSALTEETVSLHKRRKEADQIAFELRVLLNRALAAHLRISQNQRLDMRFEVCDAELGETFGAKLADVSWDEDTNRWQER